MGDANQVGKNIPVSPLIRGSPVQLLGRFLAPQLIDDWKRFLGIDIADHLGGIEEILLYRCQTSQVDFFIPSEAAGRAELYEKLREFDWYYMAAKWEFAQALRDLGDRRRILEVGSGTGLFVERAMKELTKSRVQGIELNERAVLLARQKDLPVDLMSLGELIHRGETFDALCSFQVLEHVHQPREFLEAMIKLLTPGGLLILGVPNRDSFLGHQYNLLDMPPHHMTRWNRKVFEYLPRLFPLKLLGIRYEPLAPYHVAGYVEAYCRFWSTQWPFLCRYLSVGRIRRITDILRQRGLYRFLRGQSLYGVFQRV
jgi:SAM-dependent methyltransferase